MLQDSSKADGLIPDFPPTPSRDEASGDSLSEMIEVFHSLGIMVVRGPTITAEESDVRTGRKSGEG